MEAFANFNSFHMGRNSLATLPVQGLQCCLTSPHPSLASLQGQGLTADIQQMHHLSGCHFLVHTERGANRVLQVECYWLLLWIKNLTLNSVGFVSHSQYWLRFWCILNLRAEWHQLELLGASKSNLNLSIYQNCMQHTELHPPTRQTANFTPQRTEILAVQTEKKHNSNIQAFSKFAEWDNSSSSPEFWWWEDILLFSFYRGKILLR